MSTHASRLDALEHAQQQTQRGEFQRRYDEFMDVMHERPVTADDYFEYLPEAIMALRRDIVRDALDIRNDIAAGITPVIECLGGVASCIVAVPLDRTVPEPVVDIFKGRQDSLFPPPWGILGSTDYPGFWIWDCLYTLALGEPDGATERQRLHDGYYFDLSADDAREGRERVRDRNITGYLDVGAQVAAAIRGESPTDVRLVPPLSDVRLIDLV